MTGKLVLLVGVILLGALLNSTTVDTMLGVTASGGASEDSAQWTLVGSLCAQIAMLLAAIALAVFKPGGRTRVTPPGSRSVDRTPGT